ncbi:aldose 1-epimerase family protein [Methylorubrum salsuginis]|uniref:Galactose mutarotase n=1 Tax=Methylorubrum salsuginis TaxID=414703 RepID=A0A1I4I0T4_9HYPH|nr:aldose 1-epimerase family protein [Methylorubrum salsuginis]SFL48048.1 Galactose mutarotase [Methylorubrum salsuginis]
MSETIEIRAGDGTTARIALHGAEPISWQVGGSDYLWSGDPEHWNRHAPWLFPVVGASAGGAVRVGGRSYPMAQHGFARDLPFTVVAQADDAVTLRLEDDAATRAHYPFAFRLDVTARVAPGSLAFDLTVTNPGDTPLPYGLGFHPAFPWPFAGGERRAGGGYAVLFEKAERPFVPEVGEGGLLVRSERALPLDGARLDLDPALFTEALVFLNAESRALRFVAPGGEAIAMRMRDFPHLAVWTRPTAPFLSLEAWTGHADWAGFDGELSERDSQRLLAPGASAGHGVVLSLEG